MGNWMELFKSNEEADVLVYTPCYVPIFLDVVDVPTEKIIESAKKEQTKRVIKSFKKLAPELTFLREEHQIVPNPYTNSCVNLLSAYYFKKKES